MDKQNKPKGKDEEGIWGKNIGGNADIGNNPSLKVDWEKLPGLFDSFIHDLFGKKPEAGAKVPSDKTTNVNVKVQEAKPGAAPAKPAFDLRDALGLAPQAPTAPAAVVKAPTAPAAVLKAPKAPVTGASAGQSALRLVPPPSPSVPAPAAVAAPTVGPSLSPAGSTQNIEVTQTLNFNHEGKDAARTGDSTKKAVQAAFRQMSAQAQGT